MKEKESTHVFTIFLIYISLLVYFSFTVIGISDRQIIITKAVTLPILNMDIALNGFFITVPLIAILLFVCFQLYLYKMKTFLEYPEFGLIGKLFRVLTAFFQWISLPLFLFLVAFKYIKTHEPVLSYVIGSTPIMGTFVVLGFSRSFKSFRQKKSFKRMILRVFPILSVIAIELFLLLFLIPRARGGLFYLGRNLEDFFKHMTCINLSHQKLITEPEEDYKNIPWGNFKQSHLEGALLRYAILKRANLKSASLKNSNMAFAVLEDADLSFANLLQANFWNANLRGANLFHAYLLGANLREADLQRANLRGANLRYARLFQANFQEADLSLADIRHADLWIVNFQGANLFHTNLQGVSLYKSNLAEANLKDANLQNANLWKANLRGANFEETDLRGVEGLDVEQLAEVKTLYKAKLDQALLKQIKEKYPQLLEKPEKKK